MTPQLLFIILAPLTGFSLGLGIGSLIALSDFQKRLIKLEQSK